MLEQRPEDSRKSRDDSAEVARFVQEIKDTADKLAADRPDRGDIKLISRTLKELRYSFKLLSRYRQRPKVTIFGSARTVPMSATYQQAVDFGRVMAEAGYMVVTGAGPGIMEAGHKGAGAEMSIGINIRLPFEQSANIVIAENEKLINLNYFFTRKLLLLRETNAVVLFPGGFGTLDEGFEVITLIQTGKAQMMPIVMLDSPGSKYWEHWLEYVDTRLYREGMISKEDFALFRIVHTVEEAKEEIERFYKVFHSLRYVRGRLVLRLNKPIPDALFEKICAEYADILAAGQFERGLAHSDEANDPHAADLPRLYIPFNRRSPGRLRQLIDLINEQA